MPAKSRGSAGDPDPDLVNDRAELAKALAVLKGSLSYADLFAAAEDLTPSLAREASGIRNWMPESLPRGTVSDWISGRGVPTGNKLLTLLVVCEVPRDKVRGWMSAVDRARRPPPEVAPPAVDETGPPARREPSRRHILVIGMAIAAALLVVATAIIVSSWSAAHPSESDAATAETRGQAVIAITPDVANGCRTAYTITGDLHADPDAVGTSLWVVAVLSAPPNVLYYPKTRVVAKDGRFTVTIPANTQPGRRSGRFGLVVSPNDRADADLQQSQVSDETHADSLYPDTRRIQLRLGNYEVATTPFIDQNC